MTIRPQGDERAHPLWPAFCAWCLDYLRLKGEVAPYAYWHCYLAGAVQGAKKVVTDLADKGRGEACS